MLAVVFPCVILNFCTFLDILDKVVFFSLFPYLFFFKLNIQLVSSLLHTCMYAIDILKLTMFFKLTILFYNFKLKSFLVTHM